MRGFTLFGIISGLVLSTARTIVHQGHEQVFNYTSPSEVFGPVNSTIKARSIARRRAARLASGNPEHYARRTPGDCSFPFNVLILQDATGSFERSFFTIMGQALTVLADEVFVDHPGSTFSIVSYQDKPINELGEESDRCFSVELLATDDSAVMLDKYSEIVNGGGYDWPENQFGALVATLESPQSIPWIDKELGTPLIIHITDSGPHYDGDSVQALYPQLSRWPGYFDESHTKNYCTRYYYPNAWDVANTVIKHNAYVSTLIFNSHLYGDLALDAWTWFNSLLDQDDCFVTAADDDSLSWLAHFVEVINNIRGEECGPMGGTTTTAAPPASGETTSVPPVSASTSAQPSGGTTEAQVTPQGTLETATPSLEGSGSTLDGGSSTTTTPGDGTPSNTEDQGTVSTTACECPSEDPCCQQQPEFLLAILRRPSELDIHMKE